MPLTKLDERIALIVIDLQKGIVAMPTAPFPVADILDNNARLAKAFRQRGLPVVLVNVKGGAPGRTDAGPNMMVRASDWAELVPQLEQQPDDFLVTKQQWGAFTGTALDQFLRRRSISQVVVTGVATSMGVESTARNAHELGYNVVLVVDAMADRDTATHEHSTTKIFPRLGETTSTAELLKMVDSRS